MYNAQPAEQQPLVVAYVLKMFPRFSETFILNEILELERRNVKVVIFSMKQPNETVSQPGVARVRGNVHVVPPLDRAHLVTHLRAHLSAFARAPRRYLQTVLFAYRRGSAAARTKFMVAPFIARHARAAGAEHFHAHFASGPTRQAKLASLLTGIPFSFTAHAKDLFWNGHRHGKNNKLKKRVHLASFVVTISEYNRCFIEGLNFKVPHRRLVTIYNGLDLDQWHWMRPTGRPVTATNPPLILAVGRLVPKKGFHDLIEACRILDTEGCGFQCVIAGEGPERKRLETLIRKYDLGHRISLPGSVPQDRLTDDYYARASLLVQPSIVNGDGDQDGIPTVILEALAVGLPVVSTPVSGIGEAVVDGETGLIAGAGNYTGLAGLMQKILSETTTASHLSRGGRSLVDARFNLRQNAKVLIHLLETSARGGTRWSEGKLRERVGLGPLVERVQEAAVHVASTES